MNYNMGPILTGDHTVNNPTIILLSNVNTYVSAANCGHHLQTLLIFLLYLHPSAEHQRPSWSPDTYRECKPAGRMPNRRNTTILDCTDNLGAEDNGSDRNNAPCSTSFTSAQILEPQSGREDSLQQVYTRRQRKATIGQRGATRMDEASKITADTWICKAINRQLARHDKNKTGQDKGSEIIYSHGTNVGFQDRTEGRWQRW